MAGGTYGAQVFTVDSTKTGDNDVVFRPAAGASVTTGTLTFGVRGQKAGASHVTMDGQNRWITGEIDFFLPSASQYTSDVTLANMRVKPNSGVFIRGTDRLTLRNVEIGPIWSGNDGMNVSPKDNAGFVRDVTNLTFDGVYMHDVVRFCAHLPSPQSGCVDQSSAHTDCIQWWSGMNVVIRNSRFYNCSTSTWLIQGEYGGHVSDWTIENNMLGPTLDNSSNFFYLAGANDHYASGSFVLRNNSITGSLKLDQGATRAVVTSRS